MIHMFPSFVKRADYLMKDSIVSATLYTLILENNGNLYFALGKQCKLVLCTGKQWKLVLSTVKTMDFCTLQDRETRRREAIVSD